jgi:hypothetical protein
MRAILLFLLIALVLLSLIPPNLAPYGWAQFVQLRPGYKRRLQLKVNWQWLALSNFKAILLANAC